MKLLGSKRKIKALRRASHKSVETPEEKISRIQDLQLAAMVKAESKQLAVTKAKERKANYKPTEHDLEVKRLNRQVTAEMRALRLNNPSWSIPADTDEEFDIKLQAKLDEKANRRKHNSNENVRKGLNVKRRRRDLFGLTPRKNQPETLAKRNELSLGLTYKAENRLEIRDKHILARAIRAELASAREQLSELQSGIRRLEYRHAPKVSSSNRKDYTLAVMRVIDGIEYISHEYKVHSDIKTIRKRLNERERAMFDPYAMVNRYSKIRQAEVQKNNEEVVGLFLFEGHRLTDDSICIHAHCTSNFNCSIVNTYKDLNLGTIKELGEYKTKVSNVVNMMQQETIHSLAA